MRCAQVRPCQFLTALFPFYLLLAERLLAGDERVLPGRQWLGPARALAPPKPRAPPLFVNGRWFNVPNHAPDHGLLPGPAAADEAPADAEDGVDSGVSPCVPPEYACSRGQRINYHGYEVCLGRMCGRRADGRAVHDLRHMMGCSKRRGGRGAGATHDAQIPAPSSAAQCTARATALCARYCAGATSAARPTSSSRR